MEKMHVSSPSQPTQAAHGTAPAKNRATHGQGTAVAGDFFGMLSALGETMFSNAPILEPTVATDSSNALASDSAGDNGAPSRKLLDFLSTSAETMSPSIPNAPVLEAAPAATDSGMASLLALQAVFSGATHTPLSPHQPAATTDTVSLGGNNALLSAGIVPTSTNAFATGFGGMALASGGGELGLVAQTAALDGSIEAQAEQGLSTVAKKIPAAARLSSPATEALAARTPIGLRQALDRSTSGAALTATLQTALMGTTDAPRDLAAAGAGVQIQSAWGAPSPSMEVPVGLLGQDVGLSSNGQSTAGGGEGGRNASGQNLEASGFSGVGGLSAESTTVGESPVFDGTSALPAEDAVAEQVSYWVSQNIQNAELTVEHDGHPVEVTVTLNGNEAHVSFRSDQDETRTLLDASVAQLRDLLESQGLNLSGMTVGDSASQGNSDNNADQRQGAKNARQTSVQASVATDGKRSTGTVTDKAVDIFV